MTVATQAINTSKPTEGFLNRDRKEIIGLFLSFIKGSPGVGRTKLQFALYLSSKQMVYFTEVLSKWGLINVTEEDNARWKVKMTYDITEKGEKYIKVWQEMNKLLTE